MKLKQRSGNLNSSNWFILLNHVVIITFKSSGLQNLAKPLTTWRGLASPTSISSTSKLHHEFKGNANEWLVSYSYIAIQTVKQNYNGVQVIQLLKMNKKGSWREREKRLLPHLSADGCFHALWIRPTWMLSKLTLISLSFSTASVSDDFFFSCVASLSCVAFFLKFQINSIIMQVLYKDGNQIKNKNTSNQWNSL